MTYGSRSIHSLKGDFPQHLLVLSFLATCFLKCPARYELAPCHRRPYHNVTLTNHMHGVTFDQRLLQLIIYVSKPMMMAKSGLSRRELPLSAPHPDRFLRHVY